jgi:hypothetical protein
MNGEEREGIMDEVRGIGMVIDECIIFMSEDGWIGRLVIA